MYPRTEKQFKEEKKRLVKKNLIKGIFFKKILWENMDKAEVGDLEILNTIIQDYRFGANFYLVDESGDNVGKEGLGEIIKLKISEKEGLKSKPSSIQTESINSENKAKKSKSFFSGGGWGFSSAKRTQSGRIDGRSLKGGAKRAREMEKEDTVLGCTTFLFSIPFAIGIANLSWIIFNLFLVESSPPATEYLQDIWTWVSLTVLIYVIFGISKGSMHAIFSLVFGLFPAMLFGGFALIGYLFRSIF